MKAYKIKRMGCVLLSSMMILMAVSGCDESGSRNVNRSSKMTTEDFGSEKEVDGVQDPNQEIDEGALIPDSTTEEDTSTAASSHYEDDILSFDLPGDAYYEKTEAMGKATAFVKCYAMPDDDYKAMIREGHTQLGADESQIEESCNIPYEFIRIFPDSKYYQDRLYDEDISSASEAADYCYDSYVKTGYNESSTEDIGCVGRTTTTIDGQTAYVIWHRGNDDNVLINMTSYEIYLDSPKGTIVKIMYSYQGEGFKKLEEYVLDSIKFK